MSRANMAPSNSPKASTKKKGCSRSIPDPHADLYCQEYLAKPIYLTCNCQCKVKDNPDVDHSKLFTAVHTLIQLPIQ